MRLQEILLVSALVFSQGALNSAFADTYKGLFAAKKTPVPKEESSSQRASLSKKEQKQKNARLIEAISDNNVDDVKILLDKGADPNARGIVRSALRIAIDLDNLEIAELLVDAGAKNEGAELIKAIEERGVEAVKELLKAGANPNSRETKDFKSALIVAIEAGTSKIVDVLIEAQAKATHHHTESLYEGSPLEAAIEKGDIEILEKVLKAGAGRKIPNEDIMEAALNLEPLNLDVIRFLVSKNKVASFYIGSVHSKALLDKAMERNSPEVVEMFLKKTEPAFFNSVTFDHGEALLNKAVSTGNTKIMELILDRVVVNPEIKNKFQRTIFHLSHPFSKPVVNGRSALVRTVELGNADGVKLLLDRGVDPNIRVQDGSLRDYAQKRGQTEIVEILNAKSAASCSAAFGGSK